MVFTRIIASFKVALVFNQGAAWVSFIRRNGVYVTSKGLEGNAPPLSLIALKRIEKIISR